MDNKPINVGGLFLEINTKGADEVLEKLDLLHKKLKDVDDLIKEISSAKIAIEVGQVESFNSNEDKIERLKREILSLNNVYFRDDVKLLVKEGLIAIAKDKWNKNEDYILTADIGDIDNYYWYKIDIKCDKGVVKKITRFKDSYSLMKQKGDKEIYIYNDIYILIES